MAESDVHEPVNIGNPDEFTLLELAKVVIEVTESRSEIVFEALPIDDPQVRQPDITRAKRPARLGAAGRASRRPAHDDRAGRASSGSSAPATEPAADRWRAARRPADRPPDRDLPALPGRRRQHRVSASPASRLRAATTSRCSRPRPRATPPDPGGAIVHRLDPVLAIGNAPLIPSLARIEGFDVVHLHYPFIFGVRADARRPPDRATAPAGAARPLQEPAGRQGPARGAVRGLRAHRRARP